MRRSLVRAIVGGASAAAFSMPAGAAGQELGSSIRQQLRDAGIVERIVVPPDRELQLAHLVGQADIIVEASTGGGRAHLTKDERDIYTDYPVKVHAVFKSIGRPGLRAGDTLTVRRHGGELVMDGRTATVHESGFPPFTPHERYLLFLTPRDKTYLVVGGGQGAFVAGERYTAVGSPIVDVERLPSFPREEFLNEVRALLHFTEQ
jgi:hypothetical protein